MGWLWFSQRMRVRHLERRLASYRAARDAATRRSFLSHGESELAERDWNYEISLAEDEISELNSNQIIQMASRYDLPLPQRTANLGTDVNWSQDSTTGVICLTRAGRALIRSAVRQEQRERWERKLRWLPLLGALTGVLGTAIGVLSFLWK